MIKRCNLLRGTQFAAAQDLLARSDGPSHVILTAAVLLYILYLPRCSQLFVIFPVPQENFLYTWCLYCSVRGGI
jgi:hypothetical protein